MLPTTKERRSPQHHLATTLLCNCTSIGAENKAEGRNGKICGGGRRSGVGEDERGRDPPDLRHGVENKQFHASTSGPPKEWFSFILLKLTGVRAHATSHIPNAIFAPGPSDLDPRPSALGRLAASRLPILASCLSSWHPQFILA